jgi:hypothetical protein
MIVVSWGFLGTTSHEGNLERHPPLLEYTSTTTSTAIPFYEKHTNAKVESSTTYIPGRHTYERLNHHHRQIGNNTIITLAKEGQGQGKGKENHYKELTRKDWKGSGAERIGSSKEVIPNILFLFISTVG